MNEIYIILDKQDESLVHLRFFTSHDEAEKHVWSDDHYIKVLTKHQERLSF
jgi:hypothetical protein